ncbi:flagellar hook-basal body complex protein FliE [Amnibacterium sp. CER49]|uniref:flagellar hook-basal body complex protein FliE n=1 Tax=Amnibacterium sp. CER49 TaxID=3039161 RepID=UPI002449B463|nr:flagellar hook-basal body complex protein FliE [Amnibacterium sp. CER49]MDH2443853.1 flagellar hook-basal body complex protein FliE [Amnibacterium sp. CER49]
MAIAAIPGISGAAGIQLPTTPATSGVSPTSGTSFGNVLTNAVDNLSSVQATADSAAIKAVTSGDLTDIHQATLAATRAQVTMQLVSAVRNKGIEAFNQIMNMQA